MNHIYIQRLIFACGPGNRRADVKIHLQKQQSVMAGESHFRPAIADRLLLTPMELNPQEEDRMEMAFYPDHPVDHIDVNRYYTLMPFPSVMFDVMSRVLGPQSVFLIGRNRQIHSVDDNCDQRDRLKLGELLTAYFSCNFALQKIEGQPNRAMTVAQEVVYHLAEKHSSYVPIAYQKPSGKEPARV